MASILLADDMPAVRRAIAAVLRRAGHEVEEVGDGAAALAALQRRRFDAVVTDILMPGTDGLEVILHLAGRPGGPKVVAVSGGSGAISGQEALRIAERHADAVLPKPFENEELLQALDRLLPAAGGGR